jgi:inositol-pentakisphosphate 2-kinase
VTVISHDSSNTSDTSRSDWLTVLGKLLRLRKDLPTTIPAEICYKQWVELIAPLLPTKHLVEQSLVFIKHSGIVHHLNELLVKHERANKGFTPHEKLLSSDIRPAKRYGVYLADDRFGLLVQDMTPRK